MKMSQSKNSEKAMKGLEGTRDNEMIIFFFIKKIDFLFLTGNEVGQMRLGGTHVLVGLTFVYHL